MMKLIRRIVGVGFCVIFLLGPVPAQAQALPVTDAAYRAVLTELIDALQTQIASLQKELTRRQAATTEPSSTTTSFGASVPIVARYAVADSEDLSFITNAEHRQYYERVYELFPDTYDKKLGKLLVFAGGDTPFDAFVETIPPTHEKWLYATNEELLNEPMSDTNTELIVHELAHIISYEEVLGVPRPAESVCDSYFDRHGCPLANSYLGVFVDAFWSDADLDRAGRFAIAADVFVETETYYQEHADAYVSDYAVLSPEEDFAESFMFFVMDKDVDGTRAAEKIAFFRAQPELRTIRDEVVAAW